MSNISNSSSAGRVFRNPSVDLGDTGPRIIVKVFLPRDAGGQYVTLAVPEEATLDETKLLTLQKMARLTPKILHPCDFVLSVGRTCWLQFTMIDGKTKICTLTAGAGCTSSSSTSQASSSSTAVDISQSSAMLLASSSSPPLELTLVPVLGNEMQLRVLREGKTTTVYAWGDNEAGQLGREGPGTISVPVEVKALRHKGVVTVCAGNYLSAALTHQGQVYMWGKGTIGQLGTDNDYSSVPIKLMNLEKRIARISCGSFHVMAITEDGALYSWGNGEGGQLGHGVGIVSQYGPWRVTALKHEFVTHIACGNMHSVAAAASGLAYSWGMNEAGQLGHGSTDQVVHPKKISKLDKHRIDGVAAGFEHTLLCTEEGIVFAMGNNSLGQLGLGHADDVHLPTEIPLPNNEPAAKISCGVNHSAIVTVSGMLYTFGRGGRGRLGNNSDQDCCTPQHVPISQKVTDVCAGNAYTAIVTTEEYAESSSDEPADPIRNPRASSVLLCGEIASGTDQTSQPTIFNGPWGTNITCVHAGLQHILLVTEVEQ